MRKGRGCGSGRPRPCACSHPGPAPPALRPEPSSPAAVAWPGEGGGGGDWEQCSRSHACPPLGCKTERLTAVRQRRQPSRCAGGRRMGVWRDRGAQNVAGLSWNAHGASFRPAPTQRCWPYRGMWNGACSRAHPHPAQLLAPPWRWSPSSRTRSLGPRAGCAEQPRNQRTSFLPADRADRGRIERSSRAVQFHSPCVRLRRRDRGQRDGAPRVAWERGFVEQALNSRVAEPFDMALAAIAFPLPRSFGGDVEACAGGRGVARRASRLSARSAQAGCPLTAPSCFHVRCTCDAPLR
jgi:hypothetical protein